MVKKPRIWDTVDVWGEERKKRKEGREGGGERRKRKRGVGKRRMEKKRGPERGGLVLWDIGTLCENVWL